MVHLSAADCSPCYFCFDIFLTTSLKFLLLLRTQLADIQNCTVSSVLTDICSLDMSSIHGFLHALLLSATSGNFKNLDFFDFFAKVAGLSLTKIVASMSFENLTPNFFQITQVIYHLFEYQQL